MGHVDDHEQEGAGLRTRLGRYLPDVVYGANDGIVTTFAIVSGVIGAGLPNQVILALGFASLLADGFSMGTSDYLSERSARASESGKTAPGTAARRGLATFTAFVAAGAVALVAYVVPLPDASRFPAAIILSALTLFGLGSIRAAFSDRRWWWAGGEMLALGSAAAAVAYGIGAAVSALTGGIDPVAAASTAGALVTPHAGRAVTRRRAMIEQVVIDPRVSACNSSGDEHRTRTSRCRPCSEPTRAPKETACGFS